MILRLEYSEEQHTNCERGKSSKTSSTYHILEYQKSIDKHHWIKYDVALITLNQDFDITVPRVNPICLPNNLQLKEYPFLKVKIVG